MTSLSNTQPNQADIKIKVEVLRLTFHNQENGWTVLKCREVSNQRETTAVGHFVDIHSGQIMEFFGQWVKHQQFGRQFKVERAVESRPNSKVSIARYLASGLYKGIGPKTAEKIVKTFNLKTFDVLDKEPEKLFKVPGIGKKAAQRIIDSWQEQRGSAEIHMFLSKHGVTPVLARKVVRTYQNRDKPIIDVISENPYQLIRDIKGVGFITADRIAQSVNIRADDPQRVKEACLYQLEQSADRGHCFLTTLALTKNLADSLGLAKEQIEELLPQALISLNEEQRIVTESFPNNPYDASQKVHYLSDLWLAETIVNDDIERLNKGNFLGKDPRDKDVSIRIESWLERFCKQTSTQLSESQWAAVKTASKAKTFVLTGGPGVGKTTTANAIIQLLRAMGRSIALCAPTGRAAQRMTELSGVQAKTIHRLLEWSPSERRFTKDENSTLAFQAIIVDEASMLDIKLAASLFKAVPSTAQLILIGDVDQLPAVGPGNVLRDIIDSKQVACTHLTEVFRQAATSQITQTAHAINKGTVPQVEDNSDSDFHFIKCQEPDSIIATIKDLIENHIADAGYDPIHDVQILSPMNRGDLGAMNLNQIIAEMVHKKRSEATQGELKHHGVVFRAQDKVIQLSNNYDLGVFNGDIGYISYIHSDKKELTVDFQGRVVTYDEEAIGDLSLAYAITIHKSQGSEFPVVIIPLSTSHFVMLQRNLIYTGLTRARRLAIFVGQEKALQIATRNETSTKRMTMLRERLCQNRES